MLITSKSNKNIKTFQISRKRVRFVKNVSTTGGCMMIEGGLETEISVNRI